VFAVTLASLLPILAVEVMAIIISLSHPYDQVLREVSEAAALASTGTEPLVNRWGACAYAFSYHYPPRFY
jgi:hypothetical protein